MRPGTPTTPSSIPKGLDTAYRLPFTRASLDKLPAVPGVYVIRDAQDVVIYVGKAKNLRRRVESYFRQDLSSKTRAMVGTASFFSYITAGHEDQALVLESNLIKSYKPHYNVRLVDGKTYPLIELTNDAFPILRKTHRVMTAKNQYYGPYPKSGMLNLGLDGLRRAFPIRTCHRVIDAGKPTRPCLDFDLGLCLGPCGNRCSSEEYAQAVHQLSEFLSGKMRPLLRQLESSMEQASRSQQYERAVRYRDSYVAMKGLFERYAVFAPRVGDMDIFAFHQQANLVSVVRQALREGRLIASTDFIYDLRGKASLDPALKADLIVDFYRRFHVGTPRRIAVDVVGTDVSKLRLRVEEGLGSRISVASPRGTETGRLLRFAAENARQKLLSSTKAEDIPSRLSVLKTVLDLPRLPVRIEGYDVSNISGKDAAVSMVVFLSGKPAKAQYRLFNIHSLTSPNDPGMMKEALERRFRRWRDVSFGEPADLILVDGGETQVSAACIARDAQGINVPVVGIAKREELLIREEGLPSIRMSQDSGALLLLMAVRDEAHRFGKRQFHRQHERPLMHKRSRKGKA